VLAEELPSLLHASDRASKFEIVDVQHEQELKGSVEVARRPLFADRSKADTFNHLAAMLLPVCAAIGMAI
jgi:hypothetical protein